MATVWPRFWCARTSFQPSKQVAPVLVANRRFHIARISSSPRPAQSRMPLPMMSLNSASLRSPLRAILTVSTSSPTPSRRGAAGR